jgi:hypothetical protein
VSFFLLKQAVVCDAHDNSGMRQAVHVAHMAAMHVRCIGHGMYGEHVSFPEHTGSAGFTKTPRPCGALK